MKTSSIISDRLAAMGIQRPSPALVTALEAHLAPRLIVLVERSLTRRVVAQAFASTLVDANSRGSLEGGKALPSTSSEFGAKPNHGTGKPVAAPGSTEVA